MDLATHNGAPAGERRFDAFSMLPVLAVLAGALLLGAWYIAVAHPAYFDIDWIAFERGNQLYRARILTEGGHLYRDVAFQYGPLAAYLHAAWCAVAGIGITQTLTWHLFWSLVGISLGYLVFRRLVPPAPAALYTALLLVPLMLEPGGLIRMVNAEHQTFDRVFLLLILLSWNPPRIQTAGRAATIGLAMGAWQATKFGGAIFAGAALVLVEVAWMLRWGGEEAAWRRSLANFLVIAGVVLLCEGLVAAWCLTWATPGEMWEVLWPSYMKRAYEEALAPTARWPVWHDMRYMLQAQFLPLLSLFLGVAWWFRGTHTGAANHAIAWIAAAFYLLGIGTYISIETNFYLYGFALAPLAVAGLASLPEASRRLCTVMLLIPNAVLIRSAVTPWAAPVGQAAPDRAFELPNGESLYLTPDNLARMQRLEEVARLVHERPGDQVVLAWLGPEWSGGGYLHFYEPGFPLRNYFASPAAIRAADLDELRETLPRVGAFVLSADGGTIREARYRLGRFLPGDLVDDVMSRYVKIDALSDYWLVVLMPKS